MTLTYKTIGAAVCGAALLMAAATLHAQTAEVFTATAAVKGAGGAAASAPVTINVDRKMSQGEADKLAAAFKAGGAAALRKALAGVPPLHHRACDRCRPAVDRPDGSAPAVRRRRSAWR